MTRAGAYFNFWNDFLPAYEENSVPTGDDAPKFPYLTYSYGSDDFDNTVPLTVSLWYRGSSWIACNNKTDEISSALANGGVFLPFDGGKIWIKKGTPFAQNMGDENDDLIKRKYINLDVEFLSNY